MANKLYLSIKKFLESKQEYISYVKDFVLFSLIYGLLLTISLSILLPSKIKFNLQFIIALGIMFYFIKEELPKIIKN